MRMSAAAVQEEERNNGQAPVATTTKTPPVKRRKQPRRQSQPQQPRKRKQQQVFETEENDEDDYKEEGGDNNEDQGMNNGSPVNTELVYSPYDPEHFSPLALFRSHNDAVANLITQAGSEGVSRYDIGYRLGINAHSKTGNRKVSDSIRKVLTTFPDQISQYQKMEGRFRVLKYYEKNNTKTPGGEQISDLLEKFERITGQKFPYKLGAAVKFPGANLDTLRISDINLRRMCDIVEHVHDEKAVVTRSHFERYMTDRDTAVGYLYKIDRRCFHKCVLALEKHGFLRWMVVNVIPDECRKAGAVVKEEIDDDRLSVQPVVTPTVKVDVYTVPEIQSPDDPQIEDAVEATRLVFHREGRSFPLGRLTKVFIKEEEAALALENALLAQAAGGEKGEGLVEVEEEDKRRIVLPNFSVIIERSLLDDEIRKIDQEKNKHDYGSGKKTRSLIPKLSQFGINALAEEMQYRRSYGTRRAPPRPFRLGGVAKLEEVEKMVGEQQMDEVSSSTSAVKRVKKEIGGLENEEEEDGGADEAKDESDFLRTSKPLQPGQCAPKRKRKRIYDAVDLARIEERTFMSRSQFSPRERNMLLLIRSFSFFLNPGSRFWPDPSVMRDLMHELLPESRLKTATQLMAAGTRELWHPARFAYHQFAVKIMASYPALLALRNELASLSLKAEEKKKNAFFAEAFHTAYKILFDECESFPGPAATNQQFNAFLRESGLRLVNVGEKKYVSLRSSAPATEDQVRFCVGYNAVIATMLDREIEGGRPKPTTETQMLNAADEAAEQPHTAAVQLDQPPDLTAGEDEHNQLAGPGQPDQPVEAEVEEETTKIITREHAAPLLTQLEPAILGKLLEHLRADNLISREKNRRHHLSLPPPVVLSVAVPVPVTVDGHRQKREDEEDASAPTTTLAAAAAAGGLGEGGGGEAAAATFPPLPADPSATTSAATILPECPPSSSSYCPQPQQAAAHAVVDPPPPPPPPTQVLTLKQRVATTQIFRHFFGTSYKLGLPALTADFARRLALGGEQVTDSLNVVPSEGENPGELLGLLKYLDDDLEADIQLVAPDSLDQLFITSTDGTTGLKTATATKQLRSLEDTELRLDRIELRPDRLAVEPPAPLSTTSLRPQKIPFDYFCAENLDKMLEMVEDKELQDVVAASGVRGASQPEIMAALGCTTPEEVDLRLEVALAQHQVVACGVETRRFVAIQNARPWLLCSTETEKTSGEGAAKKWALTPRPWTTAEGGVNWAIVRFMAESVFAAVEAQPGVLVDDLTKKFIYVLQPVALYELLQFTEQVGATTIRTKHVARMTKPSPFADFDHTDPVRYVVPTHTGFERLGLFFQQQEAIENEKDEQGSSSEQ